MAKVANMTHQLLFQTIIALLLQPKLWALEKLEPPYGCYIGAFIEWDEIARGDIKLFEQLTGKKHASYITYIGYGSPFPVNWVRKVIEANAIPHIAWEPNDGLDEVQDDEYLRSWARQAAQFEFPIILRFASEMNGAWTAYFGNPRKYVAKWRLVAKVMRMEAPNVAMLWAPFCMPRENIDAYYPGDEFVDWVGVNIYSVYCHNGNPNEPAHFEDPVMLLRHVYNTYARRKPIAVAEYAATHYCKGTRRDTTDFALVKMARMYEAIARELPRVKMINWFSMDTIKAGLANNNYCLTSNSYVLAAYRALISSPHFLSEPYFGNWFTPTKLLPRQPLRLLELSPPLSVPRQSVWINHPKIEPMKAMLNERVIGTYGITLLGLCKGDIVYGSRLVWLHVPRGIDVRFVSYRLNGRAILLTNKRPYYARIEPTDGQRVYCLSASVCLSNGEVITLPEVQFEFVNHGTDTISQKSR
ncbi:MAG: glycosyl hydrolase [Armatimonadota bacterium]|nr:glycosyl hydrolase [Armatimonadota bacterium]MCX7777684.1 glycosyl hydrolase [Armatimonadota bacterium]MDW8025443.1 glycosyl hydrolase [Armatimonadota bacterium]